MNIGKGTRARLKVAKTIKTGGPLRRSKVSLCLYSPTIDIAKISTRLRCAPTQAHEKGQTSRPKAIAPSRVGLWSLQAPNSLKFEEQIQYLLEATPKSLSTWRGLAKEHDIQLRCGIFLESWNEGFELPATVVTEIGRRGWKFSVDIYSAEGNEVIEAFLAPALQSRGR